MPRRKKTNLGDFIKLITTVAGLIAISFSVFFFNEGRYAAQVAFAQLEQRVSYNEVRDVLNEALDNMYFYRKMLRSDPNNEDLKQKVQEAEAEVEALKKQLEKLKQRS